MPEAVETVAGSRRLLLDAIGEDPDLTLVRAPGNLGDELIRAGTLALLAGRPLREIALDELPSAGGQTVLLPGSGAWCRPYHEWTPHALGIAELRFQRVIVLPSSFDPGEDTVRRALERTRAVVFAREQESLRLIGPLCDARLAHDCAFFFDFSPYARPGAGMLSAFRTDPEAAHGEPPSGNRDVSVEAAGLDEWLELIAAHEVVRTDRAHVMIAAALMGKTVQVAPSSYHKIPALLETWLRNFPVELIPPVVPAPPRLRPPRAAPDPGARVTAVVVSRDRPDSLERTARSVARSSAVSRILVIDSNSDPACQPRLAGLAAEDVRIAVRRSERDVGRAGGRRRGIELAETDLVLLVEDDVELSEGAIELLIAALEGASGVTPVVVDSVGTVVHYGGEVLVEDGVAQFRLDGAGRTPAELPPSGPTGWLPAACLLARTSVLRQVPIDERMVPGYDDAEWSFRASASGFGFRRCRDAVVTQADGGPASPPSSQLAAHAARAEWLVPAACFMESHGLVPWLDGPSGSAEMPAPRRLLELVSTRGVDWTVMEWMNGRLDSFWADAEPTVGSLSRLAGRLKGRLTQ